MKKCNKCGVEKELDDFRDDKRLKCGKYGICIECETEYKKKYYDNENQKRREKRARNKKPKQKTNRKEYLKKYRENNKEYFRQKKKEYNSSKKGKVTKRKWCNKYNKENPHIVSWRSLLQNTIKQMNTEKKGHTIDELGYSAVDLKQHMEKLFTKDMCWENHGEWHIDHIKPVSSFDKNTPVSIVSGLDNLQPLWAITRTIDGVVYEGNLNKSNKIE